MNKKAEKFLLSMVKDNYDDIAIDFNETRKKPMLEMVQNITKNLFIEKNKKILDLGCGNGRFFNILSNFYNNFFYIGVDNNDSLINYARERYGEKFKVANILNLKDLEYFDFDYIFSWAVFHHIPGNRLRLELLSQIYNKLNTQGCFIFSVWKLRKKNRFYQTTLFSFLKQIIKGRIIDFGDLIFAWRGNSRKKLSPRYYHAFSKKEIIFLLKKTKFKTKQFLEDDFNYYFILKK